MPAGGGGGAAWVLFELTDALLWYWCSNTVNVKCKLSRYLLLSSFTHLFIYLFMFTALAYYAISDAAIARLMTSTTKKVIGSPNTHFNISSLTHKVDQTTLTLNRLIA